jgi:hypothetical protein
VITTLGVAVTAIGKLQQTADSREDGDRVGNKIRGIRVIR